MKLLSSYQENNKTAHVYFDAGRFIVRGPDNTETEYATEFQAESAAEDLVLATVDSGKIVVFPRRG